MNLFLIIKQKQTKQKNRWARGPRAQVFLKVWLTCWEQGFAPGGKAKGRCNVRWGGTILFLFSTVLSQCAVTQRFPSLRAWPTTWHKHQQTCHDINRNKVTACFTAAEFEFTAHWMNLLLWSDCVCRCGLRHRLCLELRAALSSRCVRVCVCVCVSWLCVSMLVEACQRQTCCRFSITTAMSPVLS